jgi:hypothetical protein
MWRRDMHIGKERYLLRSRVWSKNLLLTEKWSGIYWKRAVFIRSGKADGSDYPEWHNEF